MVSEESIYDGSAYTEMWLRRCTRCPKCGSTPVYHVDSHDTRMLTCTHPVHVYGAEPIEAMGDSLQRVVSEWNRECGSGWTMTDKDGE